MHTRGRFGPFGTPWDLATAPRLADSAFPGLLRAFTAFPLSLNTFALPRLLRLSFRPRLFLTARRPDSRNIVRGGLLMSQFPIREFHTFSL